MSPWSWSADGLSQKVRLIVFTRQARPALGFVVDMLNARIGSFLQPRHMLVFSSLMSFNKNNIDI